MRIQLSLVALFLAMIGYSQVIWTEDFSAGSAARGTSAVGYPALSGGTWSQTITGAEGGSANQWYISGEECGNAIGTCGSVCSNIDASLHISAIGGLCGTPDCGAAYNETGVANATNRRIESPNINTTGFGTLTLDFGFIAAQGDDGFTVEYSCDGGVSWNTLAAPAASQCCSCLDAFACGFFGICCPPQTQQACTGGEQGFWTNSSLALPPCTENIANLRIGFLWTNDGDGLGTDPSVAIDDITITSSMPLPVELVNVQAHETRNGNQLNWKTLSETNNSHFEVEHRTESNEFETIGRVDGQGTKTSPTLYSWAHKEITPGDNYYRLKQVDFNGFSAYSQTMLVRNSVTEENRLFLYPNPANQEITVQYYSTKSALAKVVIADLSGRVLLESMKHVTVGEHKYTLDLSALETGNYFCIIEENGRRTAASFVKE